MTDAIAEGLEERAKSREEAEEGRSARRRSWVCVDLEGRPGGYALVGALAADEKGHLYVADSFFRKIEVFRRLSDGEGRELMKLN